MALTTGTFLFGLAGKLGYDAMKAGLQRLFRHPPDELADRLFAAVDRASVRFFEERAKRYGRPADSFLARQENLEAIGASLHFTAEALKPEALDPSGFGGAPDATEEDLRRFIELLREESLADFFLAKHLTEHEHMRRAHEDSATLGRIKEIVEQIATSSKPKDQGSDKKWTVVVPGGTKFEPEQGQIYELAMPDGLHICYMLHGERVGVEIILPDGASWYTDVDADGNSHNTTLPYPIEDYTIVVDPSYILSQESRPLGNGLVHQRMNLKWGKTVDAILDSEGRLKQFQITKGAQLRHAERQVLVIPPPGAAQ